MTYRDHLHPWCIVRLLPEARSTVVARFRDRIDAETHLKLLNQLMPSATYQTRCATKLNPHPPAPSPKAGEGE